jgi:hypothetical protein
MKPLDEPTLYLIGFRIEPDIFDPQMYTIYVNDDRPILCKGQPILFPRSELAASALSKSDCGASLIGPASTELYTVYDITEAIYTLNVRDEDTSSELLNLINLIFDFCQCTKEEMPECYRKDLVMLADHLTFNNPFSDFLRQHNLSRQALTDAVFWSIGMIIYSSKIIIA